MYDILVQESRQLMSVGKLDEAEAKARMAQRMNVVPPLTADRAESVLHEIAMARAQKAPTADCGTGRPRSPRAARMEREANQLLAKGDQEAAAAKFSEADRVASERVARGREGGRSRRPGSRPGGPSDRGNGSEPDARPGRAGGQRRRGQQPALAMEGPQRAAGARGGSTGTRFRPRPQPRRLSTPAAPGQSRHPAAPRIVAKSCSVRPKELYKNGNYQASKQLANEAKAGKFGVEAQADELIAQIALAEQGGALSLYEAALAALRTGDNGRARALLTEVAAAGDSLDEGMRAKVDNLLQKLSTDDKGKADGKSGTRTAQDAEALAAQKLNAEVGTKIAEGRRLHETDPDKAIAIYEKTVQAVQASGLSPDLTRPMVRRLEVAIEMATKDKVAFEAKMQDKKLRAEIEMKRLRILEADKAKKTADERLDG